MRRSKASFTARHVALQRATFERPTVPLGDAEAEARLYQLLPPSRLPRRPASTRRMERRTAFFDRETLAALRRGVQQVVIVGAGYDGRALRFATPGVRWFEVDHPSTQADKLMRLSEAEIPTAHIVFVTLELTEDDIGAKMRTAGHDPELPTFFVVEGLLGYLSRPVSEKLLFALRSLAAPGSRLAVTFPTFPKDPTTAEKLRLKLRGLVVAMVGEPWLVRFEADEPDALLRSAGWEIADSLRPEGGKARYAGRRGVLVAAEPARSDGTLNSGSASR